MRVAGALWVVGHGVGPEAVLVDGSETEVDTWEMLRPARTAKGFGCLLHSTAAAKECHCAEQPKGQRLGLIAGGGVDVTLW